MDTIKKRKLIRSSQKQLSALVDYMTNHRKFANGEYLGSMGHQLHMKEWESLRAYLSELGPDKTVEQWRTTWRDMKKRARVEGGRVRLAQNKTGNNTDVPDLNDNTLKILNVIGTECSLGLDLEETPIAIAEVITVGPSDYATPTYTDTSLGTTLLTRSTPPAINMACTSTQAPTHSFERIQYTPQSPTNIRPTFTVTSGTPAYTRSFPPSLNIPCTITHPPTSHSFHQEEAQQSCISTRSTFTATTSTPVLTTSVPQTTQIPYTPILSPIQSEDTPHSSAIRHSNTHSATFIRPNIITTSRPKRARQGGAIRDVVNSDGQTRQVLSEICTELKLRNVQNIIKNRRHHQKRLRESRYSFKF